MKRRSFIKTNLGLIATIYGPYLRIMNDNEAVNVQVGVNKGIIFKDLLFKYNAKDFFNKKRHDGARKNLSIYDLAILVNPDDQEPPSNKKAMQ